MDVAQHDMLIVGAGNAGISLGARLLRDGGSDIAIVESQEVHRYRPLLNYAAPARPRWRPSNDRWPP